MSVSLELWPALCPVAILCGRVAGIRIDCLDGWKNPPGMMHLKFYRRDPRPDGEASNASAVARIASSSDAGSSPP